MAGNANSTRYFQTPTRADAKRHGYVSEGLGYESGTAERRREEARPARCARAKTLMASLASASRPSPTTSLGMASGRRGAARASGLGQPLAAFMITPLSIAIAVNDRNAHIRTCRSIRTLPCAAADYKIDVAKVNLAIDTPSSDENYA